MPFIITTPEIVWGKCALDVVGPLSQTPEGNKYALNFRTNCQTSLEIYTWENVLWKTWSVHRSHAIQTSSMYYFLSWHCVLVLNAIGHTFPFLWTPEQCEVLFHVYCYIVSCRRPMIRLTAQRNQIVIWQCLQCNLKTKIHNNSRLDEQI
jgi:hypothetical protein